MHRPWRSAAAAKRSWRISKRTSRLSFAPTQETGKDEDDWIFYQYRAGISEPVESSSSDESRKGAPDGSTALDLSSGGRPNVVGRVSLRAVLESLKLGFGHMSTARQRLSKSDIHGQRGAAPAMAAKVGGPRGFDSRAVVPVYMIAGAWVRVEGLRGESGSPPPPIIYHSRNIGVILYGVA